MQNDLTLALKLLFDGSRVVRGMGESKNAVMGFAHAAKREVDYLKGAFNSLAGRIAQIGISFSAVQQAMKSAQLDQQLGRIGQKADLSRQQVAELRIELFRMAKETGSDVDKLRQGFDSLTESGLRYKEALESTKAINIASAQTGASEQALAGGLTVGAQAFKFDLEKQGVALDLLDKFTAAGRKGNAELENLADIFSRVGTNAAAAGLDINKTLGFIEGLSLVERNPERLATLADSTLRVFNNANYRKDITNATGVQFYNKDGSRRDPLEVLSNLKTGYSKLKTDHDRAAYISSAFGKTDLDTQKGMRTLLDGDLLDKIQVMSKEIAASGGTLKAGLADGIDNAVAQVGRLKSALREAADSFSQPINRTLSNLIKWTIDKKENGGLEMDGKDMLAAGLVGIGGTFAAARYGSKGISALAKKFGGFGSGVVTGKALEATAGVTPVYVVNMPGGGLPGAVPGTGGTARNALPYAAAAGTVAAVVAAEALIAWKAYDTYQNLDSSFKRGEADRSQRQARRAEINKVFDAYDPTGGLSKATKDYDFTELDKVLKGVIFALQARQKVVVQIDGKEVASSINKHNAKEAKRR